VKFKIKYKGLCPGWDESLIILCDRLAEIIKEHGGELERVLDAGCGHGNYVIDEFRREIKWAVGVDLAPELTANNICLDEIRYSDLSSLPFANSSFDACLSLWVLEHLANPQTFLREVFRVLRPGGHFLFATPNRQSALVFLRSLLSGSVTKRACALVYGRKAEDIFPAHYRANSLRSLKKLFEEAKFDEVTIIPNYDPSYTSFGELTFRLSNLSDKLLSSLCLQLTKPHLVGWAGKKRG